MRMPLTRPEKLLALAGAVLLVAALFAPALAQPPHAHDFADQRTLWRLQCALDVLSNLPLALAGCWGWTRLRHAAALSRVQRACAALFFTGLLVTAAGSGWYHWAPDDAGLAIDRLAMGVAFAGLLGLAVASGISDRAASVAAPALLVLAPLAVATWFFTGNVLPWALVQFGAVPLLLVLACTGARPGGLAVRWSLVLLAYAAAKLFEMNDHAIYAASGELLSGHTLKHLAAAVAAWPVVVAVAALRHRRNGLQPAIPLAGARQA